MSTITIQAATLIDAPATRVYDIIADYRNGHPQILPKSFFTSMAVERGGHGAGTVFSIGTRLLGRRRTMRMEVTEPQPGCLLAEKDVATGAVTTFRVSPEHRGHRSHVTIHTEIPRTPGLKGFIERVLLPRTLHKVYIEELRQLGEVARGPEPLKRPTW